MKLILFTPVVKSSAIGRMASLVARKLNEYGHKVIVVRTESESFFNLPTHYFDSDIVWWSDYKKLNKLIESADAFIYQIGDSPYHQGCLTWLTKLSGIVCLHDFYLGNLFNGWARDHKEEAQIVLKNWYGQDAAMKFFRYQDMESFIEGTRNASPMTEWICSMAQSVITHSNWGIDRVLNACSGPVRVVPLAYVAPQLNQKKKVSKQTFDKWRILTVGHVNYNKRAESVIKAIAQNRVLRKNSVYQLIGHITPVIKDKLCSLATKYDVDLVISGEVDDVALMEAINQADIIACFRWPPLEAASASTIEALLYGKTTMVTDAGFYSEIPNQCTIKVNPHNEIAEIKAALEKLTNDAEYLTSIGQQGQLWARKTFTVNNYALELIDVVLMTMKSKPVIEAVNFFTKKIYDWGGSSNLIDNEYLIKPLTIFEKI